MLELILGLVLFAISAGYVYGAVTIHKELSQGAPLLIRVLWISLAVRSVLLVLAIPEGMTDLLVLLISVAFTAYLLSSVRRLARAPSGAAPAPPSSR